MIERDTQKIETQYYWVPQSIAWSKVEAFYQDFFENLNWNKRDLVSQSSLMWSRNIAEGQQSLMMISVPSNEGEGHIVLLILAVL